MVEKFDYSQRQLEDWDFVVLFVYFAGILIVGIWVNKFFWYPLVCSYWSILFAVLEKTWTKMVQKRQQQ